MRKRRPPRAWTGTPGPVNPAELCGPRGLTAELLRGDYEIEQESQHQSWHFFWNLLTDERKSRILSVIDARLQSVTVVLDRLLDPHNTAAILRTSEGLGLCRAHVISHEEQDALAHRRVTQDAHKWLEVELHGSGASAARALQARGFEVWAGHLDEKALLYTDLPASRRSPCCSETSTKVPRPRRCAPARAPSASRWPASRKASTSRWRRAWRSPT